MFIHTYIHIYIYIYIYILAGWGGQGTSFLVQGRPERCSARSGFKNMTAAVGCPRPIYAKPWRRG